MKKHYYKNKYVIALYDYRSKELANIFYTVDELSEFLWKKPRTIYKMLWEKKEGIVASKNGLKFYYKCLTVEETYPHCPRFYEINKKYGDDKAVNFLIEMEFPPHLKGFTYLVELIKLDASFYTMAEAFNTIGEKLNVDKNQVRRCVNFIIENNFALYSKIGNKYDIGGSFKPSTKKVFKVLKYIYDKENKKDE